MPRRYYLILILSGLLFFGIIAIFEPIPGYLDSDYYYAGGIQLAEGRGFTEPYIWNYLDSPQGIPHPSHSYWMPLASIISAGGMVVEGNTNYSSARLLFILISALTPVVTASLAYSFSNQSGLALTSGFLAIFSGFHAAFMPVTDNFGVFILSGGLFYLAAQKKQPWLALGVISGIMTLARNDGVLWLAISFYLLHQRMRSGRRFTEILWSLIQLFIGFLLIMSPWYFRNYGIYGSLMAPGGTRTLWLDNYEQTFSYPADTLTYQNWLRLGLNEILRDRLWAFGQNLQNAFAAHGAIILFPFIIYGAWQNRSDPRIRSAALGWIVLLAVMTLCFPFAGARGGFFHSGASFQPVWWSLAPLGLSTFLDKLIQKGKLQEKAKQIFNIALVQVVLLLTFYISWMRLFGLGWGEGEQSYIEVEAFLINHGSLPGDIVMVRNPPGYYMLTRRPAIVIPAGDESSLTAAALRYGVRYLIFEPQAAMPAIKPLYESPLASKYFNYLGEVDGIRIFEIQAN